MPSLSYYLQRAGEQAWQETLQQGRLLLTDVLRRKTQPAWDRYFRSAPSRQDVLRRCGFSIPQELAAHFKNRQHPVFSDSTIEDDPAVDGHLGFSGSMLWHTDTNSGYQWDPAAHYRQVPLSPRKGVDIKIPWELSRCHHLAVFGQRYQKTGDEKYATEFVRQCRDWIHSNPCRYGVNWVSAMEAGIRAVNWIAAFSMMRKADVVDADFVLDFLTSLFAHAGYIRTNLEYREAWVDGKFQRLNSNHYLCDLAGLLHIALLFPELHLEVERDFAARELETELFLQTTSDGIDYEHSTAYHRFVLGIFLSCFSLIEANGSPVGTNVLNRLKLMENFITKCARPDGTIPQIGDNDSGRLLPIPVTRVFPAGASQGFANPGFYCMRGKECHVVATTAGVGMKGFGSHSHNDILSFEYWWQGQSWIVDPGTYCYLPDPEARNWFRSTSAHNTVQVDNEEINPFHAEAVFQLVNLATVQVNEWKITDEEDILDAAHTGYKRLPHGITHRRKLVLSKSRARLFIKDDLEGSGKHRFEWFFQVHPSVTVESDEHTAILSRGPQRVRILVDCPETRLDIVAGWYSQRYGHREPSRRIRVATEAVPPLTSRIVIEPC
jgi:uncharacterized heparinase superfamily protein